MSLAAPVIQRTSFHASVHECRHEIVADQAAQQGEDRFEQSQERLGGHIGAVPIETFRNSTDVRFGAHLVVDQRQRGIGGTRLGERPRDQRVVAARSYPACEIDRDTLAGLSRSGKYDVRLAGELARDELVHQLACGGDL